MPRMATPRWPRSAVAALAILVLVAACGAPAVTPTPAQKAFDAANATAQAVVEATTLARQATPAAKPTAATPSAAVTLGRVRVWLLAADRVDQLGDRRPEPGQQLVRVEVAVEHAEPRAL